MTIHQEPDRQVIADRLDEWAFRHGISRAQLLWAVDQVIEGLGIEDAFAEGVRFVDQALRADRDRWKREAEEWKRRCEEAERRLQESAEYSQELLAKRDHALQNAKRQLSDRIPVAEEAIRQYMRARWTEQRGGTFEIGDWLPNETMKLAAHITATLATDMARATLAQRPRRPQRLAASAQHPKGAQP